MYSQIHLRLNIFLAQSSAFKTTPSAIFVDYAFLNTKNDVMSHDQNNNTTLTSPYIDLMNVFTFYQNSFEKEHLQ